MFIPRLGGRGGVGAILNCCVACLLIVGTAQASGWTTQRIDPLGSYPCLEYTSGGDLWVYYDLEGSPDAYYLRKRPAGGDAFGDAVELVSDGGTAKAYFAGGGTVDAAVSRSLSLTVLQSADNGDSWSSIKTYAAADDITFPAKHPSAFTEDGSDLRLFYGYEHNTVVVGAHAQIYTAKRSSGTWADGGTYLEDGLIRGAWENGDSVCVVGSRGVLYSSNNGASYSLSTGGDYIPEQIKAEDAALGPEGRIYLLHSYTYGTGENNYHLSMSYSTDTGASWLSPQIMILNDYDKIIVHPKFAFQGDTVMAVWLEDQAESGSYGWRSMKCTVSTDRGQTWGPVVVLMYLTGEERLPGVNSVVPFDLAASNDRFSILYAVAKGSDRYGVWLLELDNPADYQAIPTVSGVGFAVLLILLAAVSWMSIRARRKII